jgi:N-acetylglutamate synthase-like GNAT family acetyltransferase
MFTLRPAEEKEKAKIVAIIKTLDLSYPSQSLNGFWIAEEDGKIAGIACLEKFKDFFLLNSVGTAESFRNRGVASKLVKKLTDGLKKDVYLYTVIPGFFKKLGFEPINAPDFLPARKTFFCKECTPEACTCMALRSPKDAGG